MSRYRGGGHSINSCWMNAWIFPSNYGSPFLWSSLSFPGHASLLCETVAFPWKSTITFLVCMTVTYIFIKRYGNTKRVLRNEAVCPHLCVGSFQYSDETKWVTICWLDRVLLAMCRAVSRKHIWLALSNPIFLVTDRRFPLTWDN